MRKPDLHVRWEKHPRIRGKTDSLDADNWIFALRRRPAVTMTKWATPFSKGIEPMTYDEQQIAQAIARALETLSERLSRELSDAINQMAHQIGRAQQQQLEIIDLVGRQAEAMSARAKIRDDNLSATTNTPAPSSN
jgi:hypothetical protein